MDPVLGAVLSSAVMSIGAIVGIWIRTKNHPPLLKKITDAAKVADDAKQGANAARLAADEATGAASRASAAASAAGAAASAVNTQFQQHVVETTTTVNRVTAAEVQIQYLMKAQIITDARSAADRKEIIEIITKMVEQQDNRLTRFEDQQEERLKDIKTDVSNSVESIRKDVRVLSERRSNPRQQ